MGPTMDRENAERWRRYNSEMAEELARIERGAPYRKIQQEFNRRMNRILLFVFGAPLLLIALAELSK